jgi:type II secretory pathway pseudopilin PulG
MLDLSGTWKAASRNGRAAFTIVEMLIVVGIVILLAGLTVAASTALVEQSEIRQTEQRLKLLTLALQEWETAADRQLTMGRNGMNPQNQPDTRARFDLQDDTKFNFVISELLDVIRRTPSAASILEQLPADALYIYEPGVYPRWVKSVDYAQHDSRVSGKLTVLDAWGWPIYATHPGRLWLTTDSASVIRDDDGTIRTYNEKAFGVARQRKVCFISAGPDNDFGNYLQANQQNYLDTPLGDNVYSYSPIIPTPATPP